MDINSFVIGLAKGKKSGFYSTKENEAGGLTYAFRAEEGEGGGSMEGFHMVRFFNDDRTTLLYTVYVPTGANAIYAGETPVSTVDSGYIFVGFEPSSVNVTADTDCYAVYEAFSSLDDAPWSRISELSAEGKAENFFAVGDTKMIHIEGTVGTLSVNGDYGVYILGFNHNRDLEGDGIHFGTFKTAVANGKDLCFVDNSYLNLKTDGTKIFNINHWGGKNLGGWAGSDIRYDVLGSTDKAPSGYGAVVSSGREGYDPSSTCTTSPVPDTLMSALPTDLRAVMKPMTKYTDGKGNSSNIEGNVVATIDYLPLLAEFEILGERMNANNFEKKKQKCYDYFYAGNNKAKYRQSGSDSKVNWWTRSSYYGNGYSFVYINAAEECYATDAYKSQGLAPIFKV